MPPRKLAKAIGPPTNSAIAGMLREMAFRYEMDGVEFKPRAFEKAAYTVDGLDRPLSLMFQERGDAALHGLPGIGEGIRARIEEALETGRITELESQRRQCPVDVAAFAGVEGLGPRSLRALHEALGIHAPADLITAARKGKVRELPGFGARKEASLLKGLEARAAGAGRMPLGPALRLGERIVAYLKAGGFAGRIEPAGSLRRRRDTIGDLDILASGPGGERLMERFASMPEVDRIYARGPAKTLVRLREGMDADLRIVPAESLGAALVYFTGSREHNLALRLLAKSRGLKVNEYGVFRDGKRIAGETEESVYRALDLEFIPPELRENRGEIETARDGTLPRLIGPGDLRGDLQIQTDWTDGADSIFAMAEAARALGREYIAITDHTRDLAMAHGSDEARLMKQARAIRALRPKPRGIRVLAGAEVNIRRDGSLDIDDAALSRLDVVGAGIHSFFHLPRAEMTSRLVRAVGNPNVDILFHPSARILGRREPIEFDAEAVFAAAKRAGTALEIDAQPDRLDLKDEHVRLAVSMGVKLVISSDAHRAADLRYPEEYGLAVARRGWATKKDVLNALPLEGFLKSLKDARRGAAG